MLQADEIITLSKGSYSLRSLMAGSAYGIIWRASAFDGGPDVALKLINRVQMERTDRSLQTRWIASANTEIDFLGALAPWDERHIVRLLDSGVHDGLPVMALELLETDLGRHMAECRPAPLQILGWVAQINQALAKVHQSGWLYLDLKPANVLLTRHGAVKLADFGTNRLRSALPADAYAGTASWQAPEQFFPNPQQRYDTDQRSDYFALGALFYFLVTGVPLRFCVECGHAYRRHQHGAPSALLALWGGTMGPTLPEDEAAHFVQRFSGLDADATWCPAAGNPAADAALALLRTLLAADRDGRPQHALHISRMLAAISARLHPCAPAPYARRDLAPAGHPARGRA
jgi:serine/threonine-protein kinase